MTMISLPEPLLAALREGRLLVVWGDVPFRPQSEWKSRSVIRGWWKAAAGPLGAIALPLHGLPPLTVLSLDPTGRMVEAFEQGNIRAKKGGDPQGCIGDLGWYCIRFGLMVFGRLGYEVKSAQVVDYKVTNEGVPLDATCVVRFDEVSNIVGRRRRPFRVALTS